VASSCIFFSTNASRNGRGIALFPYDSSDYQKLAKRIKVFENHLTESDMIIYMELSGSSVMGVTDLGGM
jgi:hypothetical protein